MKNRILLFWATLVLPFIMQANNVRVGIQSYEPATKKLNLNLAWDNSWGDGSGTFRDGVWVFIKYKDITDAEWRHAIINNIPTSTILTDTLSGAGVKLDLMARNESGGLKFRGAYVRRAKPGGVSTSTNPIYAGVYNIGVQFSVTLYLPTGITLVNPEFRVYALEMVDIPTGAYSVGDGSTSSYVSGNNASSVPKVISTESAITGLFNKSDHSAISTAYGFAKGYAGFAIMKYELSNEGWVEFLNTLTRYQQDGYFNSLHGMSSGTFTTATSNDFSRSPVRGEVTSASTPVRFYCDINNDGITTLNDGQFLPAIMAIGDPREQIMAYLAWAGIRPLTAFEFEKAARGPAAPVPFEYAWGSVIGTIVNTIGMPFSDRFGPSETTTLTFDGPLNKESVVRCGFFAKPTGSTRLNSGGSFYGVMDMSNNADEFTLGYGTAASPSMPHGTGILSFDGRADMPSWSAEPFVIKGDLVSGYQTFNQQLGIRGGFRN